jgi:hypothetical protein
MVFGGSSSAVAIAAGEMCRKKNVLFFGTLTYSTATTGKNGNSHIFRECYNAWMGAKALASYLRANHRNAKYFYITADYTWGWTTEASLRRFSGTQDKIKHPGILTPFPSGYYDEALQKAKAAKAEKFKNDSIAIPVHREPPPIPSCMSINWSLLIDFQPIVLPIIVVVSLTTGSDRLLFSEMTTPYSAAPETSFHPKSITPTSTIEPSDGVCKQKINA